MSAAADQEMVGIPFLLDFDGKGGYVAGRGRAGWTVVHVAAAEVQPVLDRLPRESWMRGTHRLAEELAALRAIAPGVSGDHRVIA